MATKPRWCWRIYLLIIWVLLARSATRRGSYNRALIKCSSWPSLVSDPRATRRACQFAEMGGLPPPWQAVIPARYCVGDVGGERRGCSERNCRVHGDPGGRRAAREGFRLELAVVARLDRATGVSRRGWL